MFLRLVRNKIYTHINVLWWNFSLPYSPQILKISALFNPNYLLPHLFTPLWISHNSKNTNHNRTSQLLFRDRWVTCWHHLARTLRRSIRCWVLTRYLRILIFFSESDNSVDLDFSTNSFNEKKDSSAARLTRVENSTVSCPISAIFSLFQVLITP